VQFEDYDLQLTELVLREGGLHAIAICGLALDEVKVELFGQQEEFVAEDSIALLSIFAISAAVRRLISDTVIVADDRLEVGRHAQLEVYRRTAV